MANPFLTAYGRKWCLLDCIEPVPMKWNPEWEPKPVPEALVDAIRSDVEGDQ